MGPHLTLPVSYPMIITHSSAIFFPNDHRRAFLSLESSENLGKAMYILLENHQYLTADTEPKKCRVTDLSFQCLAARFACW
jgi:hypothetical protein